MTTAVVIDNGQGRKTTTNDEISTHEENYNPIVKRLAFKHFYGRIENAVIAFQDRCLKPLGHPSGCSLTPTDFKPEVQIRKAAIPTRVRSRGSGVHCIPWPSRGFALPALSQLSHSRNGLQRHGLQSVMDCDAARSRRASSIERQPGPLQDAFGVVALNSLGDSYTE